MLVSHQYRFIFVKTRKTGGTSTQIALCRYMDHPRDIIAPVQRREEGSNQLSEKASKNTRIPMRNWRTKDWYWSARGLPREFQEHMPAKLIRRYVGPNVWESYYSFAIDRSPWDQVVSRYFYHFRPERGPKEGLL